jgi:hypothetical protein
MGVISTVVRGSYLIRGCLLGGLLGRSYLFESQHLFEVQDIFLRVTDY